MVGKVNFAWHIPNLLEAQIQFNSTDTFKIVHPTEIGSRYKLNTSFLPITFA
jgi:hypothetical protein